MRSHISAGTGVAISNGQISIGQAVATTSDVQFNDLQVDGDTTITGNLTVNGTSTTLNTATLSVEDLNITVGKNATIGAGSTITQDAPSDKLTLSRKKQTTVDNWKRKKKK